MLTITTSNEYQAPLTPDQLQVNNLKYLKHKTKIPLIQLLRTRPDELIFDVNITVAEATSDKGLAAIAEYAAGACRIMHLSMRFPLLSVRPLLSCSSASALRARLVHAA